MATFWRAAVDSGVEKHGDQVGAARLFAWLGIGLTNTVTRRSVRRNAGRLKSG